MEKVRKIYIDMDGVLADFDRGVVELCHIEPVDQHHKNKQMDDDLFAAIRGVDQFYDRLELCPGAKDLFDEIYQKYGDRCEILSGVPKPWRRIETACADKTSWVRRLLSEDVKINLVLREEKKNYCHGPEDVLIDDFKKNIEAWENYGGTGIWHRDMESTRQKLKELDLL